MPFCMRALSAVKKHRSRAGLINKSVTWTDCFISVLCGLLLLLSDPHDLICGWMSHTGIEGRSVTTWRKRVTNLWSVTLYRPHDVFSHPPSCYCRDGGTGVHPVPGAGAGCGSGLTPKGCLQSVSPQNTWISIHPHHIPQWCCVGRLTPSTVKPDNWPTDSNRSLHSQTFSSHFIGRKFRSWHEGSLCISWSNFRSSACAASKFTTTRSPSQFSKRCFQFVLHRKHAQSCKKQFLVKNLQSQEAWGQLHTSTNEKCLKPKCSLCSGRWWWDGFKVFVVFPDLENTLQNTNL